MINHKLLRLYSAGILLVVVSIFSRIDRLFSALSHNCFSHDHSAGRHDAADYPGCHYNSTRHYDSCGYYTGAFQHHSGTFPFALAFSHS